MKYIISVLVLVLFSNVSQGQFRKSKKAIVKSTIPTYDLTNHWEAEELTLLSDIAESIEYIPLEMTKNPSSTLDGSIKISMAVSSDYFLLYSLDKNVTLYSSSGKFLREIGRKGKGPGEYLSIKGIKFSENEQSVWLLYIFR